MSIDDNGPAGQPPATGPGETIEDSGIPAATPVYTLRVIGHDLVVDGSKKGRPGDVVVVWPVKGGPLVARRLARCIQAAAAFEGSSAPVGRCDFFERTMRTI